MIDAPSDSAGTIQPQAMHEFSSIEITRMVANVILRAAQKIGVDRAHSTGLQDLCTEIVLVSPLDGRISEIEYGMAWWLLQPPGTALPF